jgi:hypothetical protein
MIDLKLMRVIPFFGKIDESPLWSEKFLERTMNYGFEGLLF